LIGDYRASIFTYAFTLLARKKQTDDTLERKSLVDFSFISLRSQTFSLLALALTMPFNYAPPESLRHGKGDRDHIVFLDLYLYIGGSVKGYSFSIYADLCSLFRQKSRKKGKQRISADPNSAAPAVTCRVASSSQKGVSIKGVGAS